MAPKHQAESIRGHVVEVAPNVHNDKELVILFACDPDDGARLSAKYSNINTDTYATCWYDKPKEMWVLKTKATIANVARWYEKNLMTNSSVIITGKPFTFTFDTADKGVVQGWSFYTHSMVEGTTALPTAVVSKKREAPETTAEPKAKKPRTKPVKKVASTDESLPVVIDVDQAEVAQAADGTVVTSPKKKKAKKVKEETAVVPAPVVEPEVIKEAKKPKTKKVSAEVEPIQQTATLDMLKKLQAKLTPTVDATPIAPKVKKPRAPKAPKVAPTPAPDAPTQVLLSTPDFTAAEAEEINPFILE